MKGKLNLTALLGLVVVITILVGVLVWPTPKEAKAEIGYTITVYVNMEDLEDPPNWEPLQTQVAFTINLVYNEYSTDALMGTAWHFDWAEDPWTAAVVDQDWEVVDPETFEPLGNVAENIPVTLASHTFYVIPVQ